MMGVVLPTGQPQAPAVQRKGRVGGKGLQDASGIGKKGPSAISTLQVAGWRVRSGCIGQTRLQACKAAKPGLLRVQELRLILALPMKGRVLGFKSRLQSTLPLCCRRSSEALSRAGLSVADKKPNLFNQTSDPNF